MGRWGGPCYLCGSAAAASPPAGNSGKQEGKRSPGPPSPSLAWPRPHGRAHPGPWPCPPAPAPLRVLGPVPWPAGGDPPRAAAGLGEVRSGGGGRGMSGDPGVQPHCHPPGPRSQRAKGSPGGKGESYGQGNSSSPTRGCGGGKRPWLGVRSRVGRPLTPTPQLHRYHPTQRSSSPTLQVGKLRHRAGWSQPPSGNQAPLTTGQH